MKPSLAGRLMLGYAAVIAGVLVSAWWGYHSLAGAELAAQHLSDRSVQGIRLTARLESLMQQQGHLSDYLLSGDPALLDLLRPHRRQFQAWFEEMAEFTHTDEERALLDKMRKAYLEYSERFNDVLRLEQAGRREKADRLLLAIRTRLDDLLTNSQRLFALAEDDMADRRAHTDAIMAQERMIISWLTGCGALLSLVFGFLLSRYAARPIYQLVLRLGASGVIDSVHVDGDELGALEAHVTALLERVRQQERALQQAEKLSELGEIASEIAHETLNPVAGVKAMLQALRRTNLPYEQLACELVDMERQLTRVEDTVRRLMRYARPLEPRVRPVSVKDLLEGSARAAALAPGARGRTIRVEAPAADALEWPLDPDLMQQVLVNLLVNGCEASPPGTAVHLQATVEGGRLNLFVRDRGPGIAPAVRERLFRPFFTTKPQGNGLGLAVSRNIVEEHGGRIEALGADGGGSTFRVSLPGGGTVWASPS